MTNTVEEYYRTSPISNTEVLYRNNIKLVNLTPHDIGILTNSGVETLESATKGTHHNDRVGLVDSEDITHGYINGIPVKSTEFKGLKNQLPEPVKGTMYIVSCLTAKAVLQEGKRTVNDLLVPSSTVRNLSTGTNINVYKTLSTLGELEAEFLNAVPDNQVERDIMEELKANPALAEQLLKL